MGTTTQTPRAPEFKPEYGQTEIVAFKFIEGKDTTGAFGPRVFFTLADERKLFVDAEDGSDIERALREMCVQRNEPVKITKIRHARGGGHSFRIESVNAAAPRYAEPEPARAPHRVPPTRLEQQLEESIHIARRDGPAAFQRNAHIASEPVAPAPPAVDPSPAASKLMGALKGAIDATIEATAYAARKGVKLEFNEEDVRCLAATLYIQNSKEGRY